MSEPFRIEWTRSGGFAGLVRTVVLDSADVEPDEQDAVAALLDRLPAEAPPSPGGADRFVHELTVSRGGTTQRLTVHDGAVPPVVEDLLARLRARRGGQDAPQ